MDYEHYMRLAIEEAEKARVNEDVPIGCVIVCDGKVIATGFNERNLMKNTLYHAEMTAIKAASEFLGDWRLEGCTLFVTVEPCPMCAGAILQARIGEVVFGAKNAKAGCFGSVLNLSDFPFNHKVKITEGILGEECSKLMSDFFKMFRHTRNMR